MINVYKKNSLRKFIILVFAILFLVSCNNNKDTTFNIAKTSSISGDISINVKLANGINKKYNYDVLDLDTYYDDIAAITINFDDMNSIKKYDSLIKENNDEYIFESGGIYKLKGNLIDKRIRISGNKGERILLVLDNSYIYTTDKKYAEAVKKGNPYAVERMNLHLKNEFKNVTLIKEYKNNDFVGTLEVCDKIKKFFVDKYKLTKKAKDNQEILTNNNYSFSLKVEWNSVKGVLDRPMENVTENDNIGTLKLRMIANTTSNGFQMTDAVRELKPLTLLSEQEIRSILSNLFCINGDAKYRLLDLPNNDALYAFTINNIELLKSEIEELRSNNPFEYNLLNILKVEKENNWNILETDNLQFLPEIENPKELKKNVYLGYDERFISTNAKIRWLTEHEFEKYVENCDDVKWIYKNGDGGKEYFSIVYFDGFYNQREFYPDYVLVLKNDSIMIVEAKGGEFGGENKNIDKTAKLKFSALKNYGEKHNIKWAFVRYYESGLRYNNTTWSEKMGKDTEWKDIKMLFS